MIKSIALIGTLDTKGDQVQYLKQAIERNGCPVMVIDVGVLGDVPFKPNIRREQIAQASGMDLNEIVAFKDEYQAMSKMAEGAYQVVKELYLDERINGVLAVGGSMGTSLALTVMKALPIGIPKLMVSTVAYSPAIVPELVSSDLMMLPWIAGLWGLNYMSKQVLDTAAGAISGAAKAYDKKDVTRKKIVAVTSLGQTVCRYMNELKPALEQRGYEVAVFHVTGMSGRIMEQAIYDGSIAAVLDLSVGVELVNQVAGGVCSAGEHRLEAAGKVGIPQIVSPGAIDAFHWGENKPFPAKYRGRPHHRHNKLLDVVVSSVKERASVGKLMAKKLNLATGPTVVVIPMKGFQPVHKPEGLDPFYDCLSNPEEGLIAYRKALIRNLKPEVKVVTLDAGLNDPPYVNTVLELFDEMMKK